MYIGGGGASRYRQISDYSKTIFKPERAHRTATTNLGAVLECRNVPLALQFHQQSSAHPLQSRQDAQKPYATLHEPEWYTIQPSIALRLAA